MISHGAIVEVRVEFDADQVELAGLAIGEFSPGGFMEEELDSAQGGGVAFSVFLPAGDEPRLFSWLAKAGLSPRKQGEVNLVPEDWNERWKEFHKPVSIGALWIGPPWQLDQAPKTAKRVVIEPAQGFGTGAHPTTQLVLALLQEQPRCSILDLGCGSGVLSVAASLLGFSPITAIDNDPVAIDSTLDNIERNNVHGIKAYVLDALQGDLPRADMILANVIIEPLMRLAPKMNAPRLILSGLLNSQVGECVARYEEYGYVLRERRDRDGWSAIVLDDASEHSDGMRNKAVW